MNIIMEKLTTLIDVSNPIWYLERNDSKISSIASSALSLIMISMLSLLECITRSSLVSLEEIKLTAIVNGIFHVDIFLSNA